jgi:hypothetical protein
MTLGRRLAALDATAVPASDVALIRGGPATWTSLDSEDNSSR